MKAVTVGIDVFPDHDDQHACAAIRRVAGGAYRVLLPAEALERDKQTGEVLNRHDFETIEEAVKWAEGIAQYVEADPTLTNPASVHLSALLEAKHDALVAMEIAKDNEILTKSKAIEGLEAELREALAKAQPQPQTG